MAGVACMAGGMHGRGACVAGGMHDRGCVTAGCAWREDISGWGYAWQGGVHGIRSMSGRYASYWNAFLFLTACLNFILHRLI